MAVNPEHVKEMIEKALPGAQVVVDDPMQDGDHLQATVVSDLFEGKGLLAQHQMVFKPLQEMLKASLHALQVKTYTPSQWEKTKQGGSASS